MKPANDSRKTYTASCHCGQVICTVEVDASSAIACNCSICRRKGTLLAFTSRDNFKLETSRDDITVYTFNTHNIRHQFCKICGCSPFGEGMGPDGKPMVAINLRCIEELDLDAIKITKFDGASLPRVA
jgi:hypothetical protein